MLARKINVAPVGINRNIRAFSLVEMLLSLTLGAVILFAFTYFYSNYYHSWHKQKALFTLQKEAHQLANYLQQHIQHIGYQGANREESNFSLFEKDGKRVELNTQCLIFFYDLNGDGCLGKRATKNSLCKNGTINNTKDLAKEIFGVKLEGKEIYIYADNRFENCVEKQCKTLLESCSGKWTKFTSQDEFIVEKLEFKWKKENQIIQFDLTLANPKEKSTAYHLTAYTYLLNEM